MSAQSRPWTIAAIVALAAFIVWLALQMSRTDRSDRLLEILALSFVAIAVAGVLATVRRRRR